MGIQSAMFSGVSGLNANSQAMNVIGNNLANGNTLGFKSSTTVFSDLLSSNVTGSGGSSQVGRGVGLSCIDSVFSQGTFETTSSNTDIAIEGSGFFILKEANNPVTYYSRAGSFSFNGEGSLVSPEGMVVQGKLFDPVDNTTLLAADPTDIQVTNVGLIPASATTELTFTTNLNEKSTPIPTQFFNAIATNGAGAGSTGLAATDAATALNAIALENITINDATTGTPILVGQVNVNPGDQVSTIAAALNLLPGGRVTATASNQVTITGGTAGANATNALVINGVNIGTVTLPLDAASAAAMKADIDAAIANPANVALAGLTSAVNGATVVLSNTTGDDISVGIVTTQTDSSGTTATSGASLTVQGAGGTPATITGSDYTAAGAATDSTTDFVKVGGSLSVQLDAGLTLATDVAGGLFAAGGVQSVPNPIDPTDKATYNYSASSQIFDSLGDSHLVTVYWRLVDDATNTWNVGYTYTMDDDTTSPIATLATPLTFNARGNLDPNNDGVIDTITETVTLATAPGSLGAWPNGAAAQTIDISFDCTQYNSDSVVIGQSQDGFAAASLTNVAINGDGIVTAAYSNGQKVNIAQLVLAKFQNPGGLELSGSNRYVASADVGTIRVGIPDPELGRVFTNSLEQSNVDMGAEFVKMITTQRGFSANSKIITTVDEMLSELINLKR